MKRRTCKPRASYNCNNNQEAQQAMKKVTYAIWADLFHEHRYKIKYAVIRCNINILLQPKYYESYK